jgi:hypothetical protein
MPAGTGSSGMINPPCCARTAGAINTTHAMRDANRIIVCLFIVAFSFVFQKVGADGRPAPNTGEREPRGDARKLNTNIGPPTWFD